MWERIRHALTANLNLKLISLAFAVVVYSLAHGLAHGGEDASWSIVADLDVSLPSSESSDQVLVGSIPQSVRVVVRGSKPTIDNLRASKVSVLMDLSQQQPAHFVFDSKMVRLPDGLNVEVEGFDPAGVDLKWEQRVERDVPVQVSVVGTPAEGFVVKGPLVVEPKMVKVRGLQSDVDVLQHVQVDAFDVHELTDGTTRQLAIKKPSVRLKFEPMSVNVTVDIKREEAERVFQKLAVAVVGTPKGKTQPAEVDVRLVCPPDIVRSLRAEQIVPQVEVSSKEPAGSESLPVTVKIDRCEAFVLPREVVTRWGAL
ncbi:MAG: CdaR family protein [Polyangiaceae bacterium]|nr:CdaR family protein [Polyangiaceae bacterium]